MSTTQVPSSSRTRPSRTTPGAVGGVAWLTGQKPWSCRVPLRKRDRNSPWGPRSDRVPPWESRHGRPHDPPPSCLRCHRVLGETKNDPLVPTPRPGEREPVLRSRNPGSPEQNKVKIVKSGLSTVVFSTKTLSLQILILVSTLCH